MMKAKIINKDGQTGKEVELPPIFRSKIREDVCQKYVEAVKRIQPYSPAKEAGRQKVARGRVKHARHKYRSAYGRGISRVPRKVFWRRGTQFYWQADAIPSAVGGIRAHPPKILHFLKKLKINKKERKLGFKSAISSTANPDYVKKRYERIEKIEDLPLIISSDVLKLKTKEILNILKKRLGDNFVVAVQEKRKRAGKGKLRGRRYKKSAGALFVIGSKEKFKISGSDVKKVTELSILDFWPLGRLTIYSEKAVEELNKLFEEKR